MKKYKIVVLTDLNNTAKTTIKSAVSLAKMINVEIEVFSVIKPTDVVKKENQLSAIRTINDKYSKSVKKMQELVIPIATDYGIKIETSFEFGNVKNEIKSFIKERKPDIIVIGKKKSSSFKLIGDGISQFVFNTFKGEIMIATDKNALEPNKEISLGMLNTSEHSMNLNFADDLMAYTQRPLKSFNIVKNSGASEAVKKPTEKKTIEYIFQHNDRSMKSLSNYLSKNNIDLLYFDRSQKNSSNKTNLMMSDITKLEVTVLVTSK